MRSFKRIIIILLLLASVSANGQDRTFEEVNLQTYRLYEQSSWNELIRYGNEALRQGHDFLLLRLRMGYAAFMKNNFSAALIQYKRALKHDSYNATAHYYSWLCLKYLGQHEMSDRHSRYFDAAAIKTQKLRAVEVTSIGIETSFKTTDNSRRKPQLYGRLDVSTRLGWNTNMQHSLATFNQQISEPSLIFVDKNDRIDIRQLEYYNKTLLNISGKLQLKLAYHFLRTPFNNFNYNNHIGLAGIKYLGNYFDVGADIILANITERELRQYNVSLGLYPLGNLNLYGYSTAMVREDAGNEINFKQVVGGKLFNKTWLELNATLGNFSNLFENDALYVYHAIDRNKYKVGATVYYTASPLFTIQLGYTNEQRQLFNTNSTFNQHSITGGLLWRP